VGSLDTLADGSVPLWQRAISFLGLGVMVAIAWAMSSDRRAFPWRIVLWGTGLQLLFGVFVLKTTVGLWIFAILNDGFVRLLDFTNEGSRFLFGAYLDREFTVALNVLPTIVFFSTLMTVLYHLGLMQKVVKGFAWAMQRTLRTSGAETLSAAANIFVGQTEAPLVVRPFVATMTKSELMSVMIGGFASVAGGVLAAYVGMLRGHFPDIAGHLLACSVMSAPASLLIAKVMLPEKEIPTTAGTLSMPEEQPYANVVDAAANGATEGVKLALNVAAMLIAFIALVAMINFVLALPAYWHNLAEWREALRGLGAAGIAVPEACSAPNDAATLASCIHQASDLGVLGLEAWEPFSLQRLLGWIFWPFAFAMGVPFADCTAVATLLGEKTVLNEFVAFLHLAHNLEGSAPISGRAAVIASYALCGFANFGSIAIQIGGIGAMAPERRGDLARLGLRAMIGGMLASNMTACVAGVLV
jgi:CNT family concentrative nucleoside transporter